MGLETKNVLFVGNVVWDSFANVEDDFLTKNNLQKAKTNIIESVTKLEHLKKDVKITASKCGGSGRNVMEAFLNLGYKCVLIGRTGNDSCAKAINEHLENYNVKNLLISSKCETAQALCLETSDKKRTLGAIFGSTSDFKPQDISDSFFEDIQMTNYSPVKHIHCCGYPIAFNPGVVEKCAAMALKNKISISINLPTADVIQYALERYQEVAKKMTYVVGKVEEFKALTQTNNIQDAFGWFKETEIKILAATDGEDPCYVKTKGKEIKDFKVSKVDKVTNKTCAGDNWAGIFLSTILKEKSTEEGVENANFGVRELIQQPLGNSMPESVWDALRKRIKI